ncbi:acetyl-CoA synthetase-like protein, partial [Westerdykella ornata]
AARKALEAFLSLVTSSPNHPGNFRLLFAAVDMVLDVNRQPLLMELEMTDPCLYLKSSDSNLATAFAKSIISNAAVYPAQQYTQFCGPHRPILPWHGPEVLFVRQTLQSPSSVALVSDTGPPVTYLELCKSAVCVSEYVSARRYPSVAILCQRTQNLISTILGCMFARLPYLLLDNSFPATRIETMLKISAIRHVLCDDSGAPIVDRLHHDIEVTAISGIIGILPDVYIDNLHERLLCRRPMKDRINNFIFTSGSTGVPKGIRIRYQALANVVQHFIEEVLIQPRSTSVVFAHCTNISFDISAIPFFVPLAVGGRIALASHRCMQDPKLLKSFLYASQSNHLLGTTSQYRLLIDSGWIPSPGNVCIQAGEVLSQNIASYILDRDSILWNFYGPAETTIWSTGCRVKDASHPISIGLPIWNTSIVLLDNAGKVSDEGEICIAGTGLGQYVVDGETRQRFRPVDLPGPIRDSNTAVLYHTGDLAQYKCGNFLYRGRSD